MLGGIVANVVFADGVAAVAVGFTMALWNLAFFADGGMMKPSDVSMDTLRRPLFVPSSARWPTAFAVEALGFAEVCAGVDTRDTETREDVDVDGETTETLRFRLLLVLLPPLTIAVTVVAAAATAEELPWPTDVRRFKRKMSSSSTTAALLYVAPRCRPLPTRVKLK